MTHAHDYTMTIGGKAVAGDDLKTALACLADEAKLLGLYPPARAEVSGPKGGSVPVAFVEVPAPPALAAPALSLPAPVEVEIADPQ
jgi:hypothetical protein